MQFQHRPGTVAHTSEVIYPPIALRGLEVWATSGDQRDTGSHVNLARTVTVGLVRGIWVSLFCETLPSRRAPGGKIVHHICKTLIPAQFHKCFSIDVDLAN